MYIYIYVYIYFFYIYIYILYIYILIINYLKYKSMFQIICFLGINTKYLKKEQINM